MWLSGDKPVAKLSRIGQMSALALPMAISAGAMGAGEGRADPWLEKSTAIAQPWDLPFVAQPRSAQKNAQQKQQRRSRSPEVAQPGAVPPEYQPAANVFPPPRPPAVAPPPDETVTAQTVQPSTVGQRVREPQPQPAAAARDRSRQAAPAPMLPDRKQPAAPARDRNEQTAVLRERPVDREVERNLERQLQRELPRLEGPTTGVSPVPEQFACGEQLAKIARYAPLPVRSGPNGCGAPDLVKLESVLMADKSVVAINPPPQIRCGMAVELAQWVRDDVGPIATAELGSPIATITGNDAYECRTRNHVKGAKISEHGRGNAFDLATFRLKNGGVFNFTDPLVAKPFRDRVRNAACGRFMTVLGPGSDAFHSGHIHLDMAERSRKAKLCQWDVREVQVAARVEEPQAAAQPDSQSLALSADTETGTVASNPDSPIADVVSPPLPRRKPEALLARAQLAEREQVERDGRRERDVWRGERGPWRGPYRNRDFRFYFRW